MDPMIIKSYESRLKDLELKVQAVLDAIKLECEYTPEKYTLVKPEGDNE